MQNWSPDKIIYFVDVRQKLHFEQAFEIAKNSEWLDRLDKNNTELFHAYN
jgi:arginyl-tRNA synthetase